MAGEQTANKGFEVARQTPRDVMAYLKSEAVGKAIAASCSKHVTPERLVRVACAAISRQPLLAACSKESLYLALTNCGQLGLEPNLLGSSYLVPYRNRKTGTYEAQFIAGYRGLVELAMRSERISTLQAFVVYERDAFDWRVGEFPRHVRYLGTEDPGQVVLAWAFARFKDGGCQVDVMTKRELDATRGRSRAKDDGPWVTDYAEMCKKTVVRRLCKLLPLTIELATALEADTAAEIGGEIEIPVEVAGAAVEAAEAKVEATPAQEQPRKPAAAAAKVAEALAGAKPAEAPLGPPPVAQ